MKKITISIFILLLFSCKDKESESTTRTADSLLNRIRAERMVDSMMKSDAKARFTKDDSRIKYPVIVTSSKIVQDEYSSFKDIRLTYKNVSGKTVAAIRFEWYGENAFGEPADMGRSMIEGEGGGFTDEPLRNGKSSSGTWSINSRDAKKVIKARACEVAFSDGTKWSLRGLK